MPTPPRRIAAYGISWYRATDYARLRAMMTDAEKLPLTFEKFLYGAMKAEEQIRRAGSVAVRVNLDDDKFPAFCRERGLDLDAKGRMAFASFVAMQLIQTDQAGEA